MVHMPRQLQTLETLQLESEYIPSVTTSAKLAYHQRRLTFFLRASWAKGFDIKGSRITTPFIQDGILHLPERITITQQAQADEIYRGMVHHLAAHIIYTPTQLDPTLFTATERHLINILDDARVEYKARQHDPSLTKLWQQLIFMPRTTVSHHPLTVLLEEVSRGLADPQHQVKHHMIHHWLSVHHQKIVTEQNNMDFFIQQACDLQKILAELELLPPERLLHPPRSSYRDDNRFLWK